MTAARPMQQQHLAQIIAEIAAKRWGMLNNYGGVHEEGEQTESSSSTERSVGGLSIGNTQQPTCCSQHQLPSQHQLSKKCEERREDWDDEFVRDDAADRSLSFHTTYY
jgi:hypothetical protein